MVEIPEYLTKIKVFTDPFEVVGTVREKIDQQGREKRSSWNEAKGWVIPVEYVASVKEKRLLNGQNVNSMILKKINITVWSESLPVVEIGNYIELIEPLVGAFNGDIYIQALGIEVLNKDFSLEIKDKK